ncbi:MAG: gamma-glutamyl-phosphate reductase, partial [Actinobacteria bacterium]|nr:gamma-glutamyl-phosphate reductase [Actinomycetota bacterium]
MSDERTQVIEVATKARAASNELRKLSRQEKDAALEAMATALVFHAEVIIKANEIDVAAARQNGTDEAIIDRLTLNQERIEAVATGLRDVAALPDPVGEVVRGYTLP